MSCSKRRRFFGGFVARAALLAALGCAWGAPALAQQPASAAKTGGPGLADGETTVWLFDAPGLEGRPLDELERGLKEALAAEKGRHVIGELAFRAEVAQRAPTPPQCLRGGSSCATAPALVFDALSLALVIRVKVQKIGSTYEAMYTLVDRRGPGKTVDARAATMRELGFALVRNIYAATGVVSFASTPSGARVLIDGSEVGKTPMTYRAPIGTHAYRLELPNHTPVDGHVEVTGRQAAEVKASMSEAQGTLIVERAPAGAQIVFKGANNAEIFKPADQPIALQPGTYSVQIRAEGYTSVEDKIEVKPGATTRREITLQPVNPLIRDVSRDQIIYNRYLFRFSFDYTLQSTSFRGARAQDDNLDLEFRKFADQGYDEGKFTDPFGVRLDLAYAWEEFGLILLSLGYLSDARQAQVMVQNLRTGEEMEVTMQGVQRLQLRPFQLFYRYFYRNIVPRIEAGIGINFQWIEVDDSEKLNQPVNLRQTEAFWSLGLGVHYYWTPNWFIMARYTFHDSFNVGVGTEHLISFGFGGAFPNIFGFEPEPPEEL